MNYRLTIDANYKKKDPIYPPINLKIDFVAADDDDARWLSQEIIPTYIIEHIRQQNSINFSMPTPFYWQNCRDGSWVVRYESDDFKIAILLHCDSPIIEQEKEIKRYKLTEHIDVVINIVGENNYEWQLLDDKLVLAKGRQKNAIFAEENGIAVFMNQLQTVKDDMEIKFLILNDGGLIATMNTAVASVVDHAILFARTLGKDTSIYVESHSVYDVDENIQEEDLSERIYERIAYHRLRTQALVKDF